MSTPAAARRWRRLAAATAGVLAVTALGPPAAAQELEARGIDRVCPAPGADEDPDEPAFTDLGPPHEAAIVCAADYGLVAGFDDGTFRAGNPITRAQMATFVVGGIEAATGIPLPVPDEPPFDDIEGSVHADSIAALADAGIVGGRGDGTFAPREPLTRGQFAKAVVNAISYADVFAVDGPLPPDNDDVLFADVEGTTFEAEITALAGVGIALGDADGNFNPGRQVTRGQLATFLMRAADYLDRHQRWKPTAEPVELVVELDWTQVPPADEDGDEPGGQEGATATAWLIVDAFDGTLAYTLRISAVEGSFGEHGRAAIHLGVAGETGPEVVRLAEGDALEEDDAGFVQGVVLEADSAVRFADLLAHPHEAYLVVATDDFPDGAVRGQLGDG